ncbi:sensor histidine kinase [Kaistella yonginensis]|uniref:sensor histidine kinase n=1 Tax=Kaistella yonginensis TaxID=658267 RepID=UPI0025B292CD|nr:ATP-binding protein [Kaistella yonginensis]MDN3606138.1 ATP-binding protein [Kaistella yonginensis]
MKPAINQNLLVNEIFAECSDAVLMVDSIGEIHFFNAAFEELLKYEKGELKEKKIQNLIKEELPNFSKKDTIAFKLDPEEEFTGINKYGAFIRLKVKSKKISFEETELYVYFFKNRYAATEELEDVKIENEALRKTQLNLEKLVNDQILITKLAEREAITSKNISSQIARNFPNGFILVLNKETEVLFAEGDAISQLGLNMVLKEGTILNKSTFFSEERKARIVKKINRTLSGDHLSFEVIYKDRYFAVNTAPLRDTQQQINSVVAVYNDISKQKEVEFSIQNALKKEQELNDLKSRFISVASHEFRTPLSAILTSAILIGKRNGADEKEKREKYLAQIERNVQNLTIILNDFLSLGKLDEGKVAAIKERFDLIAYVKLLIKENNINLKKEQSINFNSSFQEIFVNMDAKLLNHILNNLLSNASKYSSESSIIDFKIGKKNENVLLQISDYGIGIPVDDQKYLFDRFFRTKNAANIEGTGLGLNIVKQYTDLMGGTVTFESIENEGTTFWVELPMD